MKYTTKYRADRWIKCGDTQAAIKQYRKDKRAAKKRATHKAE